MRFRPLLGVALLSISSAAFADPFECDHKAPVRVAAPSAGISRVVIVGRAGSLRILGRAGATEIVASGTACASDRDDLADIRLKSERDGSEFRIEAVIPEQNSFFGMGQRRLDFEVTVPSSAAVSVTDGSGSLDIRDVGAISVVDGSGEVNIRGARGDVKVRDGSGQIEISDVTGNVDIRDGSGSIDVDNVSGSVVIDGDGSGSVDVRNVRGDFEVRRKGSGGIDYDRIGGSVRVPERHRDRD